MSYTLTRIRTGNDGTFGIWTDTDGNEVCKTCERPATGEHPCIPAGTYACLAYSSSAHPNVWEIMNVPNRTAILIHNGNTEDDSLGCVLVGDSFGIVNDLPAVLNSNTTLATLRHILPSTFQLTVKDSADAL